MRAAPHLQRDDTSRAGPQQCEQRHGNCRTTADQKLSGGPVAGWQRWAIEMQEAENMAKGARFEKRECAGGRDQ